MARFLTRCYAAVTWPEALRLATLDQTPITSIRQASNVELVHRTEWWAWWSDERLTTAIGLPESLCPESLSADAAALISEVWESDSLTPECGWKILADVQRITRSQRQPISLSRDFPRGRILERLEADCCDGQQRILLKSYQFFEEGYLCDIKVVG